MTDTYPQPATPDVIKSPDPNPDGTYPSAEQGTDSYDPADGTVEDVKEYIEAHPDERAGCSKPSATARTGSR